MKKDSFTNKIFFILLICLISLVSSDLLSISKSIALKEKVKGKMDTNESREFYELKLPKEIEPGSLLVFTVKESRKGIKEGESLLYSKSGEPVIVTQAGKDGEYAGVLNLP